MARQESKTRQENPTLPGYPLMSSKQEVGAIPSYGRKQVPQKFLCIF